MAQYLCLYSCLLQTIVRLFGSVREKKDEKATPNHLSSSQVSSSFIIFGDVVCFGDVSSSQIIAFFLFYHHIINLQ